MRFLALVVCFAFLMGCYRWAPTDVGLLQNEPGQHVRVTTSAAQIEIEDVRVEQGMVLGFPLERVRPVDGISLRPPDIVVADPRIVKLETRVINLWATIGITVGSVLAAAGLAFLGVIIAAKLIGSSG